MRRKTRSTDEAMLVLYRFRMYLVQRGIYEAVRIARQTGTVHSRQVREAVSKVCRTAGMADYWLGAVFNNHIFEWTGRYHTYADRARNIHERTVKVWRLRDPSTVLPEPEPPGGFVVRPDEPARPQEDFTVENVSIWDDDA